MTYRNATAARVANIVLGAWLFISAFLWQHSTAQHANALILGVLCVIFAAIALSAPSARYLNTVLAIWLFISVWALPHMRVGTMWNHALVAIAIFLLSLVPGREELGVGGQQEHHATT